jgi:hypothetical protein
VGLSYVPGGTTSSTTTSWANLGSSTSFTKIDIYTRIRFDMHVSCWISGAVPTVASFGVLINSVDYEIAVMSMAVASSHRAFCGFLIIPAISVATYTVQPRLRRVSGTGTVNVDISDRIKLSIWEIQE